MLTKRQKKRLAYIQAHKNYAPTRCITTIITALKGGVLISDTETLWRMVEEAYTTGKHRAPSRIKRRFRQTWVFLQGELSEYE